MSALGLIWLVFVIYAIIDCFWKLQHAKEMQDLYVRVWEIEEHENDPLP